MLKILRDWWEGEMKTYDDPQIIGFYIERHWSSEAAHALVAFYLAHWKWLWGFGATLLGIYVAYLGLKGA